MVLYVTFDSVNLFFRPGIRCETMAEARAVAAANGWDIYSVSENPRKWVVDGSGFKPHYNIGLGMHIDDRGQYREELKKRKLIEVGNENPEKSSFGKRSSYFDHDTIRTINEMGGELSDGEARGLIENG